MDKGSRKHRAFALKTNCDYYITKTLNEAPFRVLSLNFGCLKAVLQIGFNFVVVIGNTNNDKALCFIDRHIADLLSLLGIHEAVVSAHLS